MSTHPFETISIRRGIFLAFSLISFSAVAQLQTKAQLRAQLTSLISSYKATIGVAAIHIETGDTFSLNNDKRFPMQSVYKFPLALAVLNQVDLHKLSLNQTYLVTPNDLKDTQTWSPMRTKYPNGNTRLSIAELLEFAVSQSDNIACDLLFKQVNGPKSVNTFIHKIGIKRMEIVSTEDEMHHQPDLQYKNWSAPMAMSELLAGFYRAQYLSDSSTRYLMHLMTASANDAGRIKGLLPDEMKVAHKTGTAGSDDNHFSAVNDAGIVTMPDGKHLALTVYVTNATEPYDVIRNLMARISRTLYDYYNTNTPVKFEQKLHISGSGDTLPYRLLAPLHNDSSRSYPLLVYLHGSGQRGNDNESPVARLHPFFTDSIRLANYPCYLLVPQCPKKDSWVNFAGFPQSLSSGDTPTPSAALVLELIHDLKKSTHIDADRIYLTGYSMGGEGTFDLLTREPDLFAAAVPVAAIADTSKALLIKDIPLWAFHGRADSVNHVKYIRMMILTLQYKGSKPRYTEVAEAGHDCKRQAYANMDVWKWLFEQRKKK